MHIFGLSTLERVVDHVRSIYTVEFNDSPTYFKSSKAARQKNDGRFFSQITLLSDVKIGDGKRVLLNEFAARFDDIAH